MITTSNFPGLGSGMPNHYVGDLRHTPEPWLVSITKVYSGAGADIVMESFHSLTAVYEMSSSPHSKSINQGGTPAQPSCGKDNPSQEPRAAAAPPSRRHISRPNRPSRRPENGASRSRRSPADTIP